MSMPFGSTKFSLQARDVGEAAGATTTGQVLVPVASFELCGAETGLF
jgi:hypothetical protein